MCIQRFMSNDVRPQHPEMLYRELGTTGEIVSAIGMGGFHIGKPSQTTEDSIKLIRSGIDAGITFLDNCWDYNEGISEVRMGKALKDGYRNKVFLMTKLDGRTAESYEKQLTQSLERLDVGMVDLVQFHEILRMEDADRIFGKGGAMEAALRAREAGKIRYIGFTGHKDPAVHLRMFEVADKNKFHFDTVQMPVNVMDAHFRSFTREVIPVANDHGTGVLAMKTFGDKYILESGVVDPVEALHWGLSQKISVLIAGIDKPEILEQALRAVHTYKPLSDADAKRILDKTREAASEGKYELFKISTHFDGTAHNPDWLGEELLGVAS
jgi:uncharacterized protein